MMKFQLKKSTREEAVLRLRDVTYEGGEDLLEYRVQELKFEDHFACGE